MSTRNYEAMFILDNNAATADFEGTSGHVDAILEKHGATIVQKEKWDERKLAYEIKGQRRGTYYLTYFSAVPAAISKITEDAQLSETILRHLVISFEGPVDEYIANMAAERERMAEDSRENSLGGWGGGGRRGEQRRGPPPRKPAPAAAAPAATPAATPDAKPDTKSEAKSEAAPDTKSEAAPEAKSDAAPEAAAAVETPVAATTEPETSTKTEASAES